MLARLESAAVFGVDACPVHVEVDVGLGLPFFRMVGLPDASVRESRDRVRAAIRNCGFDFPLQRIVANLAPASLRKAGIADKDIQTSNLNLNPQYKYQENQPPLLVGYQAGGTRGRALQEGAKTVRIHGEDVPVRAQVKTVDGLSAHAGQKDILRWLQDFRRPPRQTYVVHGEPASSEALAATIRTELNLLSSNQAQVQYGNLLSLPFADGMLYVEPVYVKSNNEDAYPLLQRVLLSYGEGGNFVALAPTLEEGIEQLIAAGRGQAPGAGT